MGAYGLSTSVKLTLDFWKCTSMHFPSLIGSVVPVTDFDVVIVSPISGHGNSDHMT